MIYKGGFLWLMFIDVIEKILMLVMSLPSRITDKKDINDVIADFSCDF